MININQTYSISHSHYKYVFNVVLFLIIGNHKDIHFSLFPYYPKIGSNFIFFSLLPFLTHPIFFPKLFQQKLLSKILMLLWSLLLMVAILVFWRASGQGSPLIWIESSSSLCRPSLSMDMNSLTCSFFRCVLSEPPQKAAQLTAHKS